MSNRKMMMHPAWQAAHELLQDPEGWFLTVNGESNPACYTDAQVAGAMRQMGYADDIVVLYEGLRVVGYELPATWIPVDQNESLDAFPGLMETVKAIIDLPTLEDALADPAEFAAGFELVDESVHPLPVEMVPGFINGLLRSAG